LYEDTGSHELGIGQWELVAVGAVGAVWQTRQDVICEEGEDTNCYSSSNAVWDEIPRAEEIKGDGEDTNGVGEDT
jgi:hypothetical protein